MHLSCEWNEVGVIVINALVNFRFGSLDTILVTSGSENWTREPNLSVPELMGLSFFFFFGFYSFDIQVASFKHENYPWCGGAFFRIRDYGERELFP